MSFCTRMTRNRDLTDREVAELLGPSVVTVQRWCRDGRLAGAYKVGRKWRIPVRAADEMRSSTDARKARRARERGIRGDMTTGTLRHILELLGEIKREAAAGTLDAGRDWSADDVAYGLSLVAGAAEEAEAAVRRSAALSLNPPFRPGSEAR